MLRITNAEFFRVVLARKIWKTITRHIKNQCMLVVGTVLLCIAQPSLAANAHPHTVKHKVTHTSKKTKSRHKHHATQHKPKHHAQLRSGEPSLPSDEQENKDLSANPLNHNLATINLNTLAQSNSSLSMMFSVKKNLVSFVQKTVDTLRYSSYKLGGSKFDTDRGVYVVDCSNFVDRILENVYPNAYLSLVNSTGADNPATQHYFNFFSDLSGESDGHWSKIDGVEKLQAGDVLVFRYKNARGNETGGHVMVVMDKPIHVSDFYFVRIADSAPSRHSEDTRQQNESGIGIGTLLLKTNPKTGEPAAFAWGVNSNWNKKVKIAMARPIELG